MKKKKLGIIGGGASGLMAAVTAAETMQAEKNAAGMGAKGLPGAEIVIFEKKDRIGKKILATGNGKCNITNLDFSVQDPKPYYRGGNPQMIASVFSEFSEQDTIRTFEKMGVLVMSKNGYIYPLSQQAATVLDAFRFELEKLGVCVETECEIKEIRKQKHGFEVRAGGETWLFEKLILACGTPAGEKNGEGMEGYRLASSLGHSILGPWSSLVQLRCKGDFWKGLAGVRTDAEIRLLVNSKRGEKCWIERGELQLTDYGISGIPVFQLSRYASIGIDRGGQVRAVIDFMPDMGNWNAFVNSRIEGNHGRSMEVLFGGLVNKKIIQVLLKLCGLKIQDIADRNLEKRIREVFVLLRAFEVTVSAANPLSNAQVCAGGIPLREMTEDLESRIVPGLYMTGELLDVDGRCGGYNLQWAWSSGYVAGRAAVKALK